MSGATPPLTHMLSWQDYHFPLSFSALMLLFTGCYGKYSLWVRLLKNTGTNFLAQTGFVLVCASGGERDFSGVDIYIYIYVNSA